jgi:prepilin-type processing-associated H-X9-DG protein
MYMCPSQSNAEKLYTFFTGDHALTTYGGNGGTWPFPPASSPCDGVFYITGPGSLPRPKQTGLGLLEITDGTSNTLLLGERVVGDGNLDTFLHAPYTATPNPPLQPTAAYSAWAPLPGPNAAGGLLGAMATINYGHGTTWAPPPPPPGWIPGMPLPPPPPVSWPTLSVQWWARLSAYGSYHTGGVNVALCDGSVRFLRETTPLTTLQALSTRSGSENVTVD